MSVTAAPGFVAGSVYAGIRRKPVPDLTVIRSTGPATGAAMFTTNQVQAAPVVVSKEHLGIAEPRAIVVNSGVANAATGPRGELDAKATAVEAARLLGLDVEEVLVLSTGVIGVPLPLGSIRSGLSAIVPILSPDGGPGAAEAIMTTDTRPKTSVAHFGDFTVGGMAKGSGMIHPALATMLAVITTDYPLQPGEAAEVLRPAVDRSFNRMTVDGECSTNDAVVLLSSGRPNPNVSRDDLAAALDHVCSDLARQIAEDGEGATVILEIAVSGAVDDVEATAIASRIATSSLVKTAAFGKDPNWGRVVAAAGSAPVAGTFARVDIESLTVAFNGTKLLSCGRPTGADADVSGPVLRIDLDLGLGLGQAAYLSTDLSYDYVKINAEYTT